jgi:ABC-2 type transport system permease protein
MADVAVGYSLAAIAIITLLCLAIVAWMFRTGYRLRT